MLCLSPSSTLKLVDSLGARFGEKVMHWKASFVEGVKQSFVVRYSYC